ncbi:MAG: PatB family C-S lyase [Zoogloeaceae bacterium]|jgi:cystathionine beta-lyase|nr:PatB family C-S lyase [Zoogloeaceae bacterium]
MYDFRHIPDRRGSDSMKWGKYAGRDILPLWVADMDFAAPPAVLEALRERLAHGVLGYGAPQPSQVDAVLAYLERQYDWRIDAEWLVWLPGLVTGLNVACRGVGGGVLAHTPVYPPFLAAPRHSAQPLQRAPLALRRREDDAYWEMDAEAMTAACVPGTNLLLFCHPHNPVGRCWRQAELERVADFAVRHDLIVCSDEIHCDLILDADRRHLPFARLGEDAARRSITLMSPSKTFNIPGLACAFAVIPDAKLRQRFIRAMAGIVPHVNVLGLVACEAAFRHCDDWRQALLATLRRNRDRLEATVARLPGLAMTHIEATYLAWLDVRQLDLANPVAYFESQGLGLSNGADFGAPGWVRLNFGCAPELLDHALVRLQQAIEHVATAPRV